MPTNAPHSAALATTAADSEELRHWIRVLHEAYRRGAHIDLIAFGEPDGATTTCWSGSCPAADQKAAFLRWLADTTNDADVFFVPEDGQ